MPYVIDPSICPVTYSCQILTGPRTDLCSVDFGDTDGIFDPIDGSYSFDSIDMANFPPGTYQMEITGTSGLKSGSYTVDIVLVDPCDTVDLGIQASPFVDHTYVLRDAQHEQPWVAQNLIAPATQADCGPVTVEFFNDDAGKTLLDASLLNEGVTGPADSIFKVLYTEDELKKGSYPIRYRVYHTNYPANVVE